MLAARTPAADFPAKRREGKPPEFFTPIKPNSDDKLEVAKEFKNNWSVLIKWDDPLGSTTSDGTAEHFGFNNDFIAAFHLGALTNNKDDDELVLWVNHEYPNPLFVSDYTPADYKANTKKDAKQIEKERLSVGGSVVQVKRANGKWSMVKQGATLNRRFTAAYPKIAFSGPTADMLGRAIGTLANCSGGVTPWHTALSCEENYPDFNRSDKDYYYRWADVPTLAIDETRYGWVLEVDPFNELPPIKHTALGRFKHENAAVKVSKSGKLVVYMGDDEADQHLYKFVSKNEMKGGMSRKEQRKLLEEGTLYAADMAKGKWIPLDWETQKEKILKSPVYAEAKKKDDKFQITNQAELLLYTRVAAFALGATPLDRCEDCEIHPLDNTLYVAMTNNTAHGNLYGHIVRLREDEDDLAAEKFQYEVFLAGGPQSGLACPDNLAFDKQGNLWVVCDISSEKVNKGGEAYQRFANNGLFVVPTSGDSAGDAFQFASGPVECELTGPCFSPDGTTLFLSVQHPGEMSKTADDPTSRWPDGKGIPRPAVVAITGFKW